MSAEQTVDSVVRGRAMTQHYSVSRLYAIFRRFNHAQISEPKKWAEKYREKKNRRVSQTTTTKKEKWLSFLPNR